MKIHIQHPNKAMPWRTRCGRNLGYHDIRLGSIIASSPVKEDMERASCKTCRMVVGLPPKEYSQ